MKLIYKITFFYLAISLVVFLLGYLVTNQVIKQEVNYEERRFLRERLSYVVKMIEKHAPTKTHERERIKIVPLQGKHEETGIIYSDTLVMHQTLQRIEPHLKLDVIKEIKGRFYKISMYDLIVEEDDIEEGVRESLIMMYLMLSVLFVLLAVVSSYWLLKPFNKTLMEIRNFNLKKDKIISFDKSGTSEFEKLSLFLNEMTCKMKSDYKSLKEFTENASHEMQTPIAIATGKLELLLESENLTDEQILLLNSAQDSIRRLSKVGSALSLLTKIENHEFQHIQSINLSSLVKGLLYDFNELVELKEISLKQAIDDPVHVQMDSTLAAIMVTNLLQNAIRHNYVNGEIEVILQKKILTISNTGAPLTIDPDQMFRRFKKNDQSKESIGLGLAIVKKICEVSKFTVGYKYNNEKHIITIEF